jgi:hypothetical protein
VINKRLVISEPAREFHFTKWELPEFKKHFSNVIMHYYNEDPQFTQIKKDDILFVFLSLPQYQNVECDFKFGMIYPGFGFHPLHHLDQRARMKSVISQYSAVFMNDGPLWESFKDLPNVYNTPYAVDSHMFKKTRVRTKFKRIIQVANNVAWQYKGRHISEAAMKLMPYEWELFPENNNKMGAIPFNELPDIYQKADGFLNPNMIGDPPGYWVDCKYTGTTLEAGLSGCIIFWHDCMKLGNDFETVFEISSNPIEIAKRIPEIINSIDLEKHSLLTSQEFYERCNIKSSVEHKINTIQKFI